MKNDVEYIKNISKDFDIPDTMVYFESDIFPTVIILNKGEYIHVYKNKMTYQNKDNFIEIKHEELKKYLYKSNIYRIYNRKNKINKLNTI